MGSYYTQRILTGDGDHEESPYSLSAIEPMDGRDTET
jgi:hypothetical protein